MDIRLLLEDKARKGKVIMGETTISRKTTINTENIVRSGRNNDANDKEKQLAIILSSNPADDVNMPGHTWIRSAADIRTYREAMDDNGFSSEDDVTPDFRSSDVKEALRTGNITVYSSKPIRNGYFVTPSRMEAQNYAGNGRVYSQKVRLTDVAWIDNLQGQLAKRKK